MRLINNSKNKLIKIICAKHTVQLRKKPKKKKKKPLKC